MQNSAPTKTKSLRFHRHSVLFFRMRDRFLCRCSTEESVFSSNVGQYRNPQLECEINSSVQAERRSQYFPKNSCNLVNHKPSIVDSHQTGVRASSAVPGFSDWCSGAPPPSLRVLSGTIFSGAVPLTRWAQLSRATLTCCFSMSKLASISFRDKSSMRLCRRQHHLDKKDPPA